MQVHSIGSPVPGTCCGKWQSEASTGQDPGHPGATSAQDKEGAAKFPQLYQLLQEVCEKLLIHCSFPVQSHQEGLPEKLEWTSQHQTAFEGLKDALATAPVLIAPQLEKPFILCTDASGQGIGAVLEQEVEGEVHPVAYYSRKLSPRERNWGITELEALTLHQAVRHFCLPAGKCNNSLHRP